MLVFGGFRELAQLSLVEFLRIPKSTVRAKTRLARVAHKFRLSCSSRIVSLLVFSVGVCPVLSQTGFKC